MTSCSRCGRPGPARSAADPTRLAATVAESGYLNAKLYVSGCRFIPRIGSVFLLQSEVSFAVAALLLLGSPPLLQPSAAALAFGALTRFVPSRTVGVWGFTERGLQPHPDALLSLLPQTATLVLRGAGA